MVVHEEPCVTMIYIISKVENFRRISPEAQYIVDCLVGKAMQLIKLKGKDLEIEKNPMATSWLFLSCCSESCTICHQIQALVSPWKFVEKLHQVKFPKINRVSPISVTLKVNTDVKHVSSFAEGLAWRVILIGRRW